MRYWSQNLNESGSIWKHGRAWLNLASHSAYNTFQIEWSFGRRVSGFSLTADLQRGERELIFHIGFPKVFSLFLIMQGTWIPGSNGRVEDLDRTIGITTFHDTAYLHLWSDRTGWGKDRTYSFCPPDFILGRYKSEIEENEDWFEIQVDMPEATYQGKARRITQTWTRKRFTFIKKSKRYIEFEFENGIPIPGKGENSWDMGDDAIMGTSVSANSIEEAVEMVKADAIRRRERYGGRNWKPEVNA